MAAKTSSGSAVISAQSSAAGSTYASPTSGCQSSDQDVSTMLGVVWTGRITNGGSAPGVGCSWQIDTSYDGSTWRLAATGQAGVAVSTSYDFMVELPLPIMHTRITFFGNTTNSVTVSAELQKATGIA